MVRAYVAPPSNRGLIAAVAATTVAGAASLLVAWRSDVEDRRMRDAPPCAQGQELTRARCRAVLDATLTELTSDHATLDLAGRQLTMSTVISRDVPPAGGRAVRVTLYRGEPVRIEAAGLTVTSDDTPKDNTLVFGFLGLFFLVAGPVGAGVTLARRPRAAAA
ncbi:hypothetical protein Daura_25870 [Dactylosporangium aurantiacum]|uniref:Transmembrane protein n=1 Tax=Dactylosporangium aurantiacum TaxID=35754 RepID=A0A9Q9IBP1_9ACTN|nr:hypothetical protein [Dactylosporangium aurantiacum]MDG6109663.1 hypothetical protein [Dactylosporangium aurantiacum]UWZ50278.1 hypothetical protein Daura_25870 [Dactylosporangium aurantiacum]